MPYVFDPFIGNLVPQSSGGGGGGVSSVNGTLNRITSTGGANPIIDISAAYVGQTSITTLGTVTTGTWNGTKVDETHGGTNQSTYTTGDTLYSSAANTLSKLAVGSSGQVLTVAAGVPSWATPAAGTVTSVSGTANRITSTGGATPVIDISASYVGQSSITTLGTVTTGVWNGTKVDETHGGTNQSTYTTGDTLYSSGANTLSKLGIGSSGQVLTVAAGIPSWATPATPITPVREFYFDAANLQALETNFAPLSQLTGGTNATNVLVRSYTDGTELFLNGKLKIPSDVASSGNVTFRFQVSPATGAASKNIQMKFYYQNITNNTSFDGTYSSQSSGDLAITATTGNISLLSFTVAIGTLGWTTANQLIEFKLSRIAASANDLASAMYLFGMSIEIPRTN